MSSNGTDAATVRGSAQSDLRLLPAAGVVWAAGLSGVLYGWLAAALVGLCAAALAAAGIGIARRSGKRRAFGACAAVLVCAVLAVGWISVRLATIAHDPLRQYAATGTEAVLRIEITERPRPISTSGYGNRPRDSRSVLITGEVRSALVAGQMVESTGRVVLIAGKRGWAGLLPGQRVTVRGTLSRADSSGLAVAVLYVHSPPPRDVPPPPWWQAGAAALRAGLHEVSGVLEPDQAGLLPALVVGDTSALSTRVEHDFEAAGMAHLTAVSGSNITILCGSVLLLLRVLRAGPRTCAAVAGLVLCGFVIVAGPQPSVLRAGVMGAVGLLGLALGRKRSAMPALAVAIVTLVTYNPAMAASFGFALSVVATAGIVLLVPRWSACLVRRSVPSGLASALAVPVAAFLVTAPVVAGMAGRISLVSIPANLLATPVIAPITVLGVAAMLLAPLWPEAAELLVRLAGPCLDWLILVARRASAVPGAVLDWPDGWLGGLSAAGAVLLLVVLLRFRLSRSVAVAAMVGIMAVLVPIRSFTPQWPPKGWSFVACDVGQGDALVLATGRPGRVVVVDTGPIPSAVDACLDSLNVRRVALVILSHLHADHIGGLTGVFDGRTVGAVAIGPGRTPRWAWSRVAERAAAAGVPLVRLHAGMRLSWPELRLDVLGPTHVPPPGVVEQDAGTVVNNSSLVLRAHTPAGRILLTGDIELSGQADLLAAPVSLRADVLKVPHHGSGDFLRRFFAAVQPRIAVISVGAENDYGHPSTRTLRALREQGALVVRTDRAGDVAVVARNGQPVVVQRETARAPPPWRACSLSREVPRPPRRPRAERSLSGQPCPRWRPGS